MSILKWAGLIGAISIAAIAVDVYLIEGHSPSSTTAEDDGASLLSADANDSVAKKKLGKSGAIGENLEASLQDDLSSGIKSLPKKDIDSDIPSGVSFHRNNEFPFKSDQLIVKLRAGGKLDKLISSNIVLAEDSLSKSSGSAVQIARVGKGYAVLKLKYKGETRDSLNAEFLHISKSITSFGGVEGFEEDLLLRPSYAVNDDRYSDQWYLGGSLFGGSNASSAWDKSIGQKKDGGRSVIAIVDTGITNHSDLNANVLPGFDFISDSVRGGDGDGWDSDASDLGDAVTEAEALSVGGVFSGCTARNSSWHGTHVSGIASAIGNNGSGIIGVASRSQIVPVRVLGKCGGYMSDVAEGVRWAAGLTVDGANKNPYPAQVINLSLGGRGACSSFLQSAINDANRAGSVVVVAAGNSALDAREFSPGNCSGVVVVGAVAQGGDRAYYSNYGSKVSISAPGGDVRDPATILSTMNNGLIRPGAATYGYYQGTSMAAPVVSGAIALALSANPKIGGSSAVSLLTKTAKKFPANSVCANEKNCGVGIVDIGAAIGVAESNMPDIAISKFLPSSGVVIPNSPFDVSVSLVNVGGLATSRGAVGKIQVFISSIDGGNKVKIGDADVAVGDIESRAAKTIKIAGLVVGGKSAANGLQSGAYGISVDFSAEDWDSNLTNNSSRILQLDYVVPQITLTKKMPNNQAPADISFQANLNDSRIAKYIGSDWVYEWKFSNGKIIKASGLRAILQATDVGVGSATLTIKNPTSGFSSSSTVNFETIAPLPSVVTFTEVSSNKFNRAPITYKFTPNITIGHPSDRVSSISWDVDNGRMTSNRTNAIITFEKGSHVVRAKVTTKMGYTAEFEKILHVGENTPPECGIDYSSPAGQRLIVFNASCSDVDGVIKNIRWTINGQSASPIPGNPYVLRIQPPSGSGNMTVKVLVLDDSKSTGEAQITVAY